MTDPSPPAVSDRDLASIQQARVLARRARAAQVILAEFTQEQIDAVVDAMAAAVAPQAEALAQLAVEETGFGVLADKIQKNRFAAEHVYRFIRPQRTVGVIRRDEQQRIVEIAEPFGVVAAIIPSTNPTSTAIYNALISLKARCAVVLSPHPSAERCISRTAELLEQGARSAGAPEGAISCMSAVTLEGTQELMRQRQVAVILATGGMGLVRAAYSAGKPAYGVGPGNAPAYIERTADVAKAVRDVVTGKTFDNGLLCSSENSVVVDADIADAVRAEFERLGGYFLSPAQAEALARVLVTPQRLPSPALVGKSATFIAEQAGIDVPASTRVLLAPLEGVGREFPLSIEKLCPVLSFYVVSDWREGCERCKQILRYGGMGHTMAIHSRREDVILEFGLRKPAFRILVNTPTSLGSIGQTTGLEPALTLGCGGYGGNITSDNIAPRHLLNVKRLAFEVRAPIPTHAGLARPTAAVADPPVGWGAPGREDAAEGGPGPLGPRIDTFLGARGYRDGFAPGEPAGAPVPARPTADERVVPPVPAEPTAVDFVSEDDVRRAIREGRRLRLAPRAIVTPAARDLAADHDVFVAP